MINLTCSDFLARFFPVITEETLKIIHILIEAMVFTFENSIVFLLSISSEQKGGILISWNMQYIFRTIFEKTNLFKFLSFSLIYDLDSEVNSEDMYVSYRNSRPSS